ncbi:MAG: hypothetical protein FWF88_03120 [Peptococcaceae bacterium]|nr:hypothetical protein [Peptococcaceae bacterium]
MLQLQGAGKSKTTKFTRKGVQVFFAVVLVAAFLAVPNTAQAVTFKIESGKDWYNPPRNPAVVSFDQYLSTHYVGQYYTNRPDQVRTVQGGIHWWRDFLKRKYGSYYDITSPGVIDGLWGTNTKNAIYSYQAYLRRDPQLATIIDYDGICGKYTWTYLGLNVNNQNGYIALK